MTYLGSNVQTAAQELQANYERALQAAYEEGFSDGQAHQTCPEKYPPVDVQWIASRARSLTSYRRSQQDEELIAAWGRATAAQLADGSWRPQGRE